MASAKNNQSIYDTYTDIIGYYAIPGISFIGIALNTFLSVILKIKKSKLKHSFYKYIFVKSIIDTIVCIFGLIYYKSICIRCGPFTVVELKSDLGKFT